MYHYRVPQGMFLTESWNVLCARTKSFSALGISAEGYVADIKQTSRYLAAKLLVAEMPRGLNLGQLVLGLCMYRDDSEALLGIEITQSSLVR